MAAIIFALLSLGALIPVASQYATAPFLPGLSQNGNEAHDFILPPESRELEVYFDTDLSNPASGVLVLGTNHISTDITGWTIRSAISGKKFNIGTVERLNERRHVIFGNGDGVFIFSEGSPSQNDVAEGEYHLYLGATDSVWDSQSDVIELLSASGTVIDTFSY